MTVIALRDQNKHKAISLEAISLSAMALNISTDDGHPNKMPFSGILVRLDEPSDAAPSGSYSRKIIVTTAAARKALPSLLGMAVNSNPSFDGHGAQAKIGVITSADIVGNAIVVSGFVYAADFPVIASSIRALKSLLGFSFEAHRLVVADPTADVLTITELAFTGAAIMRKDRAAYTTTSIAASSATTEDIDISPEELKAMLTEAVAQIVNDTNEPKGDLQMHNFTGYEPDRINAVAKRPLTFIPAKLDASALADVLERLDPKLALPTQVRAMAAVSGEPFGKSGHRISIKELDRALAATNLTVEGKIRVKLACTAQCLLPDAPLALRR